MLALLVGQVRALALAVALAATASAAGCALERGGVGDATPFDAGGASEAGRRDATLEARADALDDVPVRVDIVAWDEPAPDAAASPDAFAGGDASAGGDGSSASDAGTSAGGDAARGDAGPSVTDAAAVDASAPAPSGECSALSEEYAARVLDAQRCSSAAQCMFPVCETLCCSCHVLVNPVGSALASLAELRARWLALGCPLRVECGAEPCGAPQRGDCTSAGRCVTLRRPAG